MCGIAGLAGWELTPERLDHQVAEMCARIAHRGPDDEGRFIGHRVALGMRRLAIIDLQGGAQPIGNEDGTIQVVFNGEIYNHGELRRELQRAGHVFATRCDTEVLVHLYEDYGPDLLRHLRGMFALALWDGRRDTLLLARDRLGIKPLYYWTKGGRLAFASELKALQALEETPRRIDRRSLACYLALGYVPDPRSIFEGVHKLPPGHRLEWTREEGARVTSYWSPVGEENGTIDEEEAAEELRRLLMESVRYRLISDVPLGAFLSGGVDSSAVVAAMARAMDRPVRTFSIGFEEAEFNEAEDAAAVAAALGTDHTELILRPDVEELIEDVVHAFDEPFADSSAIPTLLVSKLARQDVTVVLSGDGGDELFGGYTRYRDFLRLYYPVLPLGRWLLRGVATRLPQGAYGRNRLLALSRSRQGRYASLVASPLRISDGGVATDELARTGLELDHLLGGWFEKAPGRDVLTQLMLVDAMSYLPGDILTKVDRMSMAVSLEARVPLLDHHLVEFAFSLPSRFKIREGREKWIFHQAVRGLVPDFVFRKPKQGFATPLRIWFRNELKERCQAAFLDHSPLFEYVDLQAVQRILHEHGSGRRDHSSMIWRLLVLQSWLDSATRGGRAPRADYSIQIPSGRGAPVHGPG